MFILLLIFIVFSYPSSEYVTILIFFYKIKIDHLPRSKTITFLQQFIKQKHNKTSAEQL